MTEPQEKESQKRIDSIITLMMEEAETVKEIEGEALRVYYAWKKVDNRVMEIMRTKE